MMEEIARIVILASGRLEKSAVNFRYSDNEM